MTIPVEENRQVAGVRERRVTHVTESPMAVGEPLREAGEWAVVVDERLVATQVVVVGEGK
jgi:hypothetical protein